MKTQESMPLETPLDWALFYASKSWSVLPVWWIEDGVCACGDADCRAPGKHPIGHMAPSGFKSATIDEDVIRTWAAAAPNMNIAIATGATSNLVVLDLDYREHDDVIIDGEFELQTWLAARGIELPSTLIQKTGGGGSHILLHWPHTTGVRPAIPSRANWLPGVDIRADGGYIVVAPSRHVSGEFYSWQDGAALAVITNDLLNVLANERKQTSGTGVSSRDLGSTQSLDVQKLMSEGFRLGGRDDGFVRLAGILRARGDSIETARMIVHAVWQKTDQSESDYFPLSLAFEKLDRGYRTWDAPEPIQDDLVAWAMRSDARAQLRREELEKMASSIVLSQNGISGPIEEFQGRETAQISGLDGAEEDEEDDEQDRDPADPFDVGAIMAGGEIEREYPTMLQRSDGRHLIYPGRLHSIYGEPGHGKTWVSLYLVRERIEAGDTVVYLDYDEDDGGKSMAMRLMALGAKPDMVSKYLRYLNPQGLGKSGSNWSRLRTQIREWKPSLVIVDTMAPALVELGLNEKDNAEVGAWYAHARWLLRGIKPQPALVIIDHVTKSGEGRGRWARGAGDKLGRLHAAYAVESSVPFSRKNPGHIRLIIAKDRGGEVGREGEAAASVKFTPHNDGQRLDISVDVPESADIGSLAAQNDNRRKVMLDRIVAVLRTSDGSLTPSEIKRATHLRGPEADDVLNEAIESKLLVADTSGRVVRYRLSIVE